MDGGGVHKQHLAHQHQHDPVTGHCCEQCDGKVRGDLHDTGPVRQLQNIILKRFSAVTTIMIATVIAVTVAVAAVAIWSSHNDTMTSVRLLLVSERTSWLLAKTLNPAAVAHVQCVRLLGLGHHHDVKLASLTAC